MEHDILCEQLVGHFTEAMRMEKILITLRDENIYLKELVIDMEVDYRNLEEKYTIASNKDKLQLQEMQNNEQKYLEIIDDLTKELASLSTQVTQAQEDFSSDEPFVASFRELETQNDLLQKTIESLEVQISNDDARLKSYELGIEQLKAENVMLKGNLGQKDLKYEELFAKYQAAIQMLQQQKTRCRCTAAQSIKLDGKDIAMPHMKRPQDLQHIFEMLDRKNEEIKAIKEYSCEEKNRLTKSILDLEDQVKQMQIKTSLLEKTLSRRDEDLRIANKKLVEYAQQDGELIFALEHEQEQVLILQTEGQQLKLIIDRLNQELAEAKGMHRDREASLLADVAALRKNLDEHSKALAKANETIINMERQINAYRKQGDAANKENALLRAELFALKENLASQEGIERSLREQLSKLQEELCNTRHDLDRYSVITEDVENYRRNCNRLKDSNYELVRKYNDLVEDYNKLEDEYRKLLDIKDQMLKELEAARNWQRDQCKQDKLIEAKITKLEEHINTLLQDRQTLIEKVNQLHRDTLLIGGELEHYKDVFSDSLSETQARTRTSLSLDLDSRNDNMDVVIRKIRRTAKKLSQTRSIWQDGIRRFSD